MSLSVCLSVVASAQINGCGGGGSGGDSAATVGPLPDTNEPSVEPTANFLQDLDGQALRILDGEPIELL